MARLFQEFVKFMGQNVSFNSFTNFVGHGPLASSSHPLQYKTVDNEHQRPSQPLSSLDFGLLNSPNPAHISAAATADQATFSGMAAGLRSRPEPTLSQTTQVLLAHSDRVVDPIFSGLPPFSSLDMPPQSSQLLMYSPAHATMDPTLFSGLPALASLEMPPPLSSQLPAPISARGADPMSIILPPLASLNVLPQSSNLPQRSATHANLAQHVGLPLVEASRGISLFLPEKTPDFLESDQDLDVEDDGADGDSESVWSFAYAVHDAV